MCKFNIIATIAVVSVGMLLAATEIASAQKKKMTYEQAYEKCRSTDMIGFLGSDTGTGTSGRYTRGAACMKKYGYRLKK